MNDKIKQDLSTLIDDELHDESALNGLLSDSEAQATLARYSIIKDVMRNRYAKGATDIAAQVRHQLEQEATVITPKQWFNRSKLIQQASGLAIAATVAAVAVMTVGDFSASKVEQTQVAVGPITDQPIKMTSAVQKKLNGYLVSHNEYSAKSKMQGIISYSRIASSPTARRLVVQTGAKLEK